MARARRFPLAFGVTLLLLALPGNATAQDITGRVLSEDGSERLPGAVVSLLDAQGRAVKSVLTTSAGLFAFLNPPAGTYRIRATMIGRRTLESDAFAMRDGLPLFTFRLPVQPIRLEGINVDPVCDLGTAEGDAAYQVLDEARKALLATQITQNERRYRFEITRTTNLFSIIGNSPSTRNPFARTEKQVSERSDPWVSLTPAQIEATGYTRPAGKTSDLYGPNTDVLLSAGFERTHCFSLRRSEGRIGLRFEVAPGRAVADIEGTLWLDAMTSELQNMEFEYRNLPRELFGTGRHAGEMRYQRLEGGTWIIQEWSLRAPLREEGAKVTKVEPLRPPS